MLEMKMKLKKKIVFRKSDKSLGLKIDSELLRCLIFVSPDHGVYTLNGGCISAFVSLVELCKVECVAGLSVGPDS